MTSEVPQCPLCDFPMRFDEGHSSCRACGYKEWSLPQRSEMTDNRHENSIFEMPRDEFMKALDERYREGVVKGWLCGGLLSIIVMAIVSGVFLLAMAREAESSSRKGTEERSLAYSLGG